MNKNSSQEYLLIDTNHNEFYVLNSLQGIEEQIKYIIELNEKPIYSAGEYINNFICYTIINNKFVKLKIKIDLKLSLKIEPEYKIGK